MESLTPTDIPQESQEFNEPLPPSAVSKRRGRKPRVYTEEEQEERRRNTSEAESQRVRLVCYVYPSRNPRWQRLVETYPPQGAQAINQASLRYMLVFGSLMAEDVIEAIRRKDTRWIIAWRDGRALPTPEGTPTYSKIAEMPIYDLNRLKDDMVRYSVRLRRGNEENDRIIAYYTQLPTSELKQLYIRLAILIASETPEIGDQIKLLYN